MEPRHPALSHLGINDCRVRPLGDGKAGMYFLCKGRSNLFFKIASVVIFALAKMSSLAMTSCEMESQNILPVDTSPLIWIRVVA